MTSAPTLRRAMLLAVTMLAAPLLTPRLAAQQAADPAAAAWAAGEHARARELYSARVRADSADVEALHRLGLLHGWNRNFDESVRLLRRLIAVAPSTSARLDLARVLSWSGDFDAAVVAYDAVLVEHPDDTDALRGRAQVAAWRGEHDAAERMFRQLITTAPADALAHIGLSQLLRWRGRTREALAHAQVALRLQPDSRDAVEQLGWAEAAFRPRFTSTFAHEADSDHNALLSAAVTASGSITQRMAVEAHAQVRRATSTPPWTDYVARSTRAAALRARVELGTGWLAVAAAGVTERAASDADATPTWAASLASPAWHRITASAAYTRTVLDFTADLMGRDITNDEVVVSLGARMLPSLRVTGAASLARFHGNVTNERQLVRVGIEASPTASLRLRPRATAFRFASVTHEGYFAPDAYVLAEAAFAVEQWRSGWSLSAELAPGAQRIGSSGAVQGALSGQLRIGYTIAPGRSVVAAASASNLGIQRLEAGSAAYRHHGLSLSTGWSF